MGAVLGRRLIHQIPLLHPLGIEPVFWQNEAPKDGAAVLPLVQPV